MNDSNSGGAQRTLVLVLAAAAVMLLAPASASALKFGAKLKNPSGTVIQPANAGHTCEEAGDGELGAGACTRIPYSFPGAGTGLASKAPKSGKLKALKLVALDPGSFRFQLGKARPGPGRGKITRKGPRIKYKGDKPGTKGYDIESFKLRGLRVRKGERIAVRANFFSAETCTSGGSRALLFQPPLNVGGPFANADGREDSCKYLLQVVYR